MSKQLKVLMVTGSFPPDICGVGDYLFKLFNAVRSGTNVDVAVYKGSSWGAGSFIRLIKGIRSHKADIIHIQYPTEGYGYSLLPQLCALFFRRKVVVTLHELSNRNLLGKLSTIALLFIAKRIIFTIEEEQAYARKICPWIMRKSTVINIGSNIPIVQEAVKVSKQYDFIYFGHIRPVKGIETFIELADLAKQQQKDWRFVIAGQTLERFNGFYSEMQLKTKGLNVDWIINIDENEVSRLLQSSKIAYLPFPDGVSLRRGTFIAALVNDVTIITTKGKNTPASFNQLCWFADDTSSAIEIAGEILEKNATTISKENSRIYAERFLWSNIAEKHYSVYKAFDL